METPEINLSVLNEICQELSVGALRDQVRSYEESAPFKQRRAEWQQVLMIMIDLKHLWPKDCRLKGRNHTPRYFLTGPFERCMRITCSGLYETMYIGGGPKKRGDEHAIAPRVFINAVIEEMIKRKLMGVEGISATYHPI
jgi:hypothetical protein